MQHSRRAFVRMAAAAGAGFALAPRLARAAAPPIEVTRLSDTLAVFGGAGGNVLAVTGPDGVVLVNGGSPDRSPALLDAVAAHAPGRRVTTLINTDWHPEQTGSNEALARTGAAIVAHVHTRQYLARDMFVDWRQARFTARPGALPTQTTRTPGVLMAGAERIEYRPLGQAHTDGDLGIFLPQSNVLVTGELMTVGAYPIGDYTSGGWLGGMVTAAKALLDLTNESTRIVPGTGPLQTRGDLQALHDMLAAMRERIAKMMRQGMGAEEMLAAGASREFDARWGAPDVFVSTAYRGMWLHVRELGGIV